MQPAALQETSASMGAGARLAQSAERKALNLVVVGSSPTVGVSFAEWRRQRGDSSAISQERR